MNPTVTVIICTHNRSTRLRRTLRSLLAQQAPLTDWDLIIMADACSDETPRVVEEMTTDTPVPVRVCKVDFRALSAARNRGAEQAAGHVLIFLDDDAEPVPGWLATYANYFRLHPTVLAGGGPIEVDWSETPKPAYWQPHFDVNLAGLRLGPEPSVFPRGEYPFGANMFLHGSAFRTVGRFDTKLGMKGNSVLLGEDTEWFMRYAAQGGPIGYVPGALVKHWANPAKTTRRSLLLRSWRAGQAMAVMPGNATPARGWSQWLRHATSATLRGRLTLSEQIYLVNWLGQLWRR